MYQKYIAKKYPKTITTTNKDDIEAIKKELMTRVRTASNTTLHRLGRANLTSKSMSKEDLLSTEKRDLGIQREIKSHQGSFYNVNQNQNSNLQLQNQPVFASSHLGVNGSVQRIITPATPNNGSLENSQRSPLLARNNQIINVHHARESSGISGNLPLPLNTGHLSTGKNSPRVSASKDEDVTKSLNF